MGKITEEKYDNWKKNLTGVPEATIEDIILNPSNFYEKEIKLDCSVREATRAFISGTEKGFVLLQGDHKGVLVAYIEQFALADESFIKEGDEISVSGVYNQHETGDDLHVTLVFNHTFRRKLYGED